MDNSIEAQIQKAELEGVEEDKINFVREEILFPVTLLELKMTLIRCVSKSFCPNILFIVLVIISSVKHLLSVLG